MKKIILILLSFVLLGAGQTFAQDKAKLSRKPNDKAQQADKSVATPNANSDAKLKKDGTPDMRYKDNKAAKEEAKPAGPMKKDGTPDKRYKANQDASATPQKK